MNSHIIRLVAASVVVSTSAVLLSGDTASAGTNAPSPCRGVGCFDGPQDCAEFAIRNPECGEPEIMCCPEPDFIITCREKHGSNSVQ